MRVLAAVGVALAVASCTSSPPRARAAGATPIPASALPLAPDPATVMPGAGEVGLPLLATADGLTAEQVAAAEPDEVGSLTVYDSWGWVTESTRRFGAGARTVEVSLLLTESPDGAALAYAYLAEQAATAPLTAGACPGGLARFRDCTLGTGGGAELVVARAGAEVLTVRAAGADPVAIAEAVAGRID